jgi:hypothetical protein
MSNKRGNLANLTPFTSETAREAGKKAYKKRKQMADFKRTLAQLLTAEIDSPEWTPFLKSIGLPSTLETVINAALIKKAMSGDVRAYEVIAKYSGQIGKTEMDVEEQKARTDAVKSKLSQDKDNDAKMEEILKNMETMNEVIRKDVENRNIEDYE